VTPEGRVKSKLFAWLKNNFPGAWFYAPPGGAFGKSGTSDRIGLWRGIFFAIEVKADRTKKLTALQISCLMDVKRNGGVAVAMYGFELEKLELLKQTIIDRSPAFVDSNEVRGLPVSHESRVLGIFSSEGNDSVPADEP
jgi:hypothetical protein